MKKIITCKDYHDFSDITYTLNHYCDMKVTVKELGFAYPNYVGLLYTGHRPSKKWIRRELTRLDLTIE